MVQYHRGLTSNSCLTFECGRKKTLYINYTERCVQGVEGEGGVSRFRSAQVTHVSCILKGHWDLILIWREDQSSFCFQKTDMDRWRSGRKVVLININKLCLRYVAHADRCELFRAAHNVWVWTLSHSTSDSGGSVGRN